MKHGAIIGITTGLLAVSFTKLLLPTAEKIKDSPDLMFLTGCVFLSMGILGLAFRSQILKWLGK